MQLINFDQDHMATSMGLPRIMVWLRLLQQDTTGSAKLGHGEFILPYKLQRKLKRVEHIMKAWEAVSIKTPEVFTNEALREVISQLVEKVCKSYQKR